MASAGKVSGVAGEVGEYLAMRCISWIAVSSKPQAEKESLKEQRASNQAVIDRLGGSTIAVLEVPGQSRYIVSFDVACDAIPAYNQLRDILDAKSADLLVCRDLSRLGRTTALIMQVISYCHRAGIAVYSLDAPPTSLDASKQAADEDALMMLAVEGALSQVEIIKLRQRNAVGMAGRTAAGRFYAKVPYGYRKVFSENGTGSYRVDEDAATVIRLIFSLHLKDKLGMTVIANRLNDMGYTSPTDIPWSGIAVTSIIDRAARYAGWAEANVRGNREYIAAPGNWEPIISQAEADEAISRRQSRAKRKRATKYLYRFSGCTYCSHCGSAMRARGVTSQATGEPILSYYCGNQNCQHRNGIPEARILEYLIAILRPLSTDDIPPAITTQAELEQARSELASLVEERGQLLSAYTRFEIITEDELGVGMDENSRRQSAMRKQINRLEVRAAEEIDVVARIERFRSVVTTGVDILKSDDIAAVNAWVRCHIRIHARDHGVEKIEYL